MVFFFIMIVCILFSFFFFFNDTATTEIYTLSLHDALPIWGGCDTTLLGVLVEQRPEYDFRHVIALAHPYCSTEDLGNHGVIGCRCRRHEEFEGFRQPVLDIHADHVFAGGVSVANTPFITNPAVCGLLPALRYRHPSRATDFILIRSRPGPGCGRSEEHTSELQSRLHLVCRLLLEKKKKR